MLAGLKAGARGILAGYDADSSEWFRESMPSDVSIIGPIEKVDGRLMLRIPLAVGGQELIGCTNGIGRVEGEFLVIEMLPWMCEKLEVSEGTMMAVDNTTGEFRMQRAVEE